MSQRPGGVWSESVASSDRKSASFWISTGDLMAGVVAVMVVLLIMTALASSTERLGRLQTEVSVQNERHMVELSRKQSIAEILRRIRDEIDKSGMSAYLEVSLDGRRMRVKDATFGLGSGCLNPTVKTLLSERVGDTLRSYLEHNQSISLLIEGHSDSIPVGRTLMGCGVADDNYTLSTVRARNARNVLVENWPEELKKRVAVSAFGPTRPLPGRPDADPANRRVEILILDGIAEMGTVPLESTHMEPGPVVQLVDQSLTAE